jgi:hypothetical protein
MSRSTTAARLLAAALLAAPVAASAHTLQAFTAPLTGGLVLNRVNSWGPAIDAAGGWAAIRAWDDVRWEATGPVLWSAPLVGGIRGFDLAPDLTLEAGRMYALTVTNTYSTRLGDEVDGGRAYRCTPHHTNCTYFTDTAPQADYEGWRTAYSYAPLAPVSTVPEPGTYALLGAGLAGVAGVRRRIRTR